LYKTLFFLIEQSSFPGMVRQIV
jgi:hypothetical protein